MKENETIVRALLKDRPIAYKPILAKALGGVTVGLWISQLLYWSDKGSNQDGWIYKTYEQWENETAMSRGELDGARKRAGLLGVVEERLAGVPATLHYRICWDRLEELLGAYVGQNDTAPEIAENTQSSLRKTSNPDCIKYANLIAGNTQTITESTTQSTQENNPENLDGEKSKIISSADFGAVQRAWEQGAGLLSKTTSDLLGMLCDEYGAEMVLSALLETVKQIGRPKIKYLEAVLQNWRDKGKSVPAPKARQSLPQIAPGVWRG